MGIWIYHPEVRPDRVKQLVYGPYADSVPDADGYLDPHSDPDLDFDPDSDFDAHADAVNDRNALAHGHPDANFNSDCDPDTDRDHDGHGVPDRDSDPDCVVFGWHGRRRSAVTHVRLRQGRPWNHCERD